MAALGTNILAVIMAFKKSLFGPRLIRIYPVERGSTGRDYEPNNLEFFCDFFIRSVSYAFSFSIYSSPVLACYIYKKGLITVSQIMYISKMLAAVGVSLSIAHILRGIGRFRNADYMRFNEALHEAKQDPRKKMLLQVYDFEFSAWPVDFKWNESNVMPKSFNFGDDKKSHLTYLQQLVDIPLKIIEYVIAHGIARPLIYPGSVKLLQNAFAEPLKHGRAYLIEKNGMRAKLLTEDGNEIDTMFLDRRNIEHNGDTLVIASEGNAGFYELGCTFTPRNAGYSVVGWNHPGFAGSSGLPNPNTEKKAMDAVIKYAVTKLGFQLENIILFAWSIGGYTASYAAMAYPQVKAVIIDATFDDLLPLANARMPALISSIVERVIRNYFSLNVEQQLLRYPGRIRLIRRLQEEIITTEPYVPATNRGNFLLINLLKHRYPNIMTEESVNAATDFLAALDFRSQDEVKQRYRYDDQMCQNALEVATDGQWPSFPCEAGKDWDADFRINVGLYLVSKYMYHFDATHCTPLPSSYFRL